MAAVDCQLRKEEKTVRRYEVATERLLQFVEVRKLKSFMHLASSAGLLVEKGAGNARGQGYPSPLFDSNV